jgi:hypothetical protein
MEHVLRQHWKLLSGAPLRLAVGLSWWKRLPRRLGLGSEARPAHLPDGGQSQQDETPCRRQEDAKSREEDGHRAADSAMERRATLFWWPAMSSTC